MTILTIAVPLDMANDANALGGACGESAADLETYQDRPNTPMQRNAAGDLFLWHSFPNWFFRQDPQGDLQRPAWDSDQPYTVNMTGAARAQAALGIWDGEGPIPQAAPGQITVVGGMAGPDALAAMGLQLVPELAI